MTFSLALLCVAAAAVVAFSVSGLLGLALKPVERRAYLRSPAAQSRVLLGFALLPVIVTAAAMIAALAPTFGWIADHCLPVADPHGHPHICAHHTAVLPSASVSILAALLVVRTAWTLGRLLFLGASARRVAGALRSTALPELHAEARVLPLREPQAFVLGVARPELFLSQGLLAAEHRQHLDTVLAHERAHLRRRDPWRRLLASLGLAFHLPGVAHCIERRLACAHEMAADEEAASAVGSRARVALALVQLARVRVQLPRGAALAFCGSDVEVRVRSLLDTRRRMGGPRPLTLAILAGVALMTMAIGAAGVHHGLEVVLGVLGG